MNKHFELKTPHYRLLTSGLVNKVSPPQWTGVDVARAVNAALAAAKEKQEKPIIVGLIPFDIKAEAMLYVPENVQWDRASVDPVLNDSQPTPSMEVHGKDSPRYKRSVSEVVRRITEGDMDKVVLARRVTVEAEQAIDIEKVYARLCARNNAAYVYRVDLPAKENQSPEVILGASPELVLGSDHRKISSFPLAGSTPRLDDPSLDQKAAEMLLCSCKDLVEHSLVVQAVGKTFHRFADYVDVPSIPELVQTPVIWHLGTHITGQLRSGVSLIELLYALHPTPAVAGWPREVAQKTISELEDFDRGHFAGLVGWMDTEGNGEWILVLRCGIINQNRATVFAGAGIVMESDPEKEHAETATKMQTFINALN